MKKLLHKILRWLRWFWYGIILRNKYFVGYDFGSKEGDYSVICRQDKNGTIFVEEEHFNT